MLIPRGRFYEMFLLLSVVLVLFLPIMPKYGIAQTSKITVEGEVKGLQGDPKQFVSVSLLGPGRYVSITNSKGVFTIRNVTPGKYTVKVRKGDQISEFKRDINSVRIDVLIVKW